jgi:CRISPR/Cas system CSM-associated protein Csm2 small subunit
LDISSINGFGYSYLDWAYAKRKQKEPNLSFDDVLKESIDKLKDEDEVVKNKRGVINDNRRSN